MKTTTKSLATALAGIALLALSATVAPATDPPGYETYVVRQGDTLSKIAGRVFGDASRWREILKNNPQVTNPNRIYPGDSLLVPAAVPGPAVATPVAPVPTLTVRQGEVPAGDAGSAVQTGAAVATAPAVEPAPEAPVQPPPVRITVNPGLLRRAGYIADQLPTLAIVASQDNRLILSSDDAAIVNAAVAPGTRFTVVRADRRVFHPKTGASLGWLIRVLGNAEVSCRGEQNSTVVLRRMHDAAGIGDYVVPVDQIPPIEESELNPKAAPGCVSAGCEDGVIVAFDDGRLVVGDQDLVYIDRGRSSGVGPGSRFTVYRDLGFEGRTAVGELQVLRAGEHTSTALITTAFQEVAVGDLLRVP